MDLVVSDVFRDPCRRVASTGGASPGVTDPIHQADHEPDPVTTGRWVHPQRSSPDRCARAWWWVPARSAGRMGGTAWSWGCGVRAGPHHLVASDEGVEGHAPARQVSRRVGCGHGGLLPAGAGDLMPQVSESQAKHGHPCV